MKFRIAILILAASVLVTSAGCISTYRAQLANKIPRVDADEIKVVGHTIYGVSGELVEKDVRWDGDVKSVGSSKSRVDSPLGSFTVEILNADIRK